MNLFSFAFVDPTLFLSTLTLKYGKHFADNDRPQHLAFDPFRDCSHIVLRGPSGDQNNWDADVDHVDYPLFQSWPSAQQIVHGISSKITEQLAAGNMPIGKAYIESIKPGGFVGWHVDESPYAKAYQRFRLLVSPCAGGTWFSAGENMAPGVGNLTHFNNRVLHSAINLGPVPQISLVVDIRNPVLQ